MLVREVMSNEAITVPLGTTVKSALAMLASARITSMPVVSASGKLRGIVSEADLIRDGVSADSRLHEIQREDFLIDRHQYVDEVMTTRVLTVGPDSDLAEAVDLMTTTGVKSVPVVAADGRVLGVVSRSDVVALLARADHDLERDVDAALASVGLRDWLVEVNDGTVELVAPARAVDDRGLARVVAGTVPGVATSTSPRPAECRGPGEVTETSEVPWTCRRSLPGPVLTPAGAGTWLTRRRPRSERPVNTRAASDVGISLQMARRLVSLAIRAPSVHNTQPWAWRIGPDGIDLYADESRRLAAADPTGRNLVISCGAALHHLRVAASASGLSPRGRPPAGPRRIPACWRRSGSPPRRHLRTAAADLRAIEERCTDRRRFTSWPVPDGRLNLLAQHVEDDGGQAVPVTDVTDRFRVDLLAARAHRLQERDVAIAEEVRRWTGRDTHDGLPADHLPARPLVPDILPSRFDAGTAPGRRTGAWRAARD